MKILMRWLALIGAVLFMGLSLNAQTPTPTPAISVIGLQTETSDPAIQILFPPPVYVLRGTVEIFGTVNKIGMSSYFLEVLPLADFPDMKASNTVWIPIALPVDKSVTQGSLGSWETRMLEDGLYALRLTANISGQGRVSHIVSPLRLENGENPFVQIPVTPTRSAITIVTPTPNLISRPTLVATPTAFNVGAPTVTAVTDANVRSGDSTLYGTVGSLLAGQSAQVLGRSPLGWYYIQLSTGRRGFISPTVVTFRGDASGLGIIQPPATPTPTFTPTPASSGDLLINGHQLIPVEPKCAENFQVLANVTNSGSRPTNAQVVVLLQDFDVETNTLNATSTVIVPVMTVGQNFVAVFNLNLSAFPRKDHRIVLTVDSQNQVIEDSETNNTYQITYRLRAGACP